MRPRLRATVAILAATALIVGVGVTPSWASDAFVAAQALRARTIQEARDAAIQGTALSKDVAPEADPVAQGTLSPDTAQNFGLRSQFIQSRRSSSYNTPDKI